MEQPMRRARAISLGMHRNQQRREFSEMVRDLHDAQRRGELRAELLSRALEITKGLWCSTFDVSVQDRALLARLTQAELHGRLNYARASRRLREWIERNGG